MVGRLTSTTPLTDLNIGSVFTTMLEAAAQEDDEQYFSMLDIIRAYSLDTTTGSDLDARATEYGLTRLPATTASTVVNLGDTAITKVSTNMYSGLPGAAAGTFSLNGSALTGFPSTGSVIVGRGTPRAETVAYTSITNNTTYVVFNLSTALAFDHGTDETIILSQGGARTFNIGTVVKVPANDITAEVDYTLDASATILDGESEVDDVAVTATTAGSQANVPIGSIIAFDSPPFATATVTNPNRVTNGSDEETDDALRDRIKSTIQSLSRGTGQSIITGITGLVSNADNKRVVSAALIEPTSPANVVQLFIDDGTGFIPTFKDIGVEVVISNASGGQKFLTANNVPIVKAFVETQNTQPYNLVGGETLFVSVGGEVETIDFVSTDFAVPGSATAQEVLTKINAVASSYEARATNAGMSVRIFARANTHENIEVTGGTANAILNFPTDEKFTVKAYRTTNNAVKLLSKDGTTATLESGSTAAYDFSAKRNLIVVVDGIVSEPEMVWIQPGDFVTPGTVTADLAVAIINQRLAGAAAEISSNDTKVTLVSNTQLSEASAIQVVEHFTSANLNATTDVTTAIKTSQALFAISTDYLYLGHSSVPFESIYFHLSTLAIGAVNPVYQFWNGSSWVNFGVYDETAGFTASGHVLFRLPIDWTQNTVLGSLAYWIRIQCTGTPSQMPVGYAKVCSANEIFNFPETAIVGTNSDYTLNRFLGQIELASPLVPGESLSLGSFYTRAMVASTAGPFGLNGGETLDVLVDGVSQIVTFVSGDFSNPGAALASEVVARLNKSLNGATASTISAGTAVQLQINGMNETLQITGGTANNFLQFPTALQTSYVSHVPYVQSVAGPFAFDAGDNVIIVMDENAANNFTTPCTFPSTFTNVSGSNFTDSTLYGTFPLANQVQNFDILLTQTYFKVIQALRYESTNAVKDSINITYTGGGTAGSEVVTVTGADISVQIQSGVSTANQIRTAVLASTPAMALLSAVTLVGSGSATQVTSSALFLTFERLQIASYAVPSGTMTLSASPTITQVTGNTYEIAPSTAAQVVAFWSILKVALITTNAEIRTCSGGTAVQIASLNAGEQAAVQVPGGPGNSKLQFPITLVIGVDGYRYFTGLAQLTQWTVDGRVSDPTDYPGIRAAGVQVEVIEPVTVPIKVDLTTTLVQGVTLSSVQNDIKSAVSSYVNSLTVGSEVVISSIVVAVKGVTGVFDVQVNTPATNIPIAYNQLARVADTDIIVG